MHILVIDIILSNHLYDLIRQPYCFIEVNTHGAIISEIIRKEYRTTSTMSSEW